MRKKGYTTLLLPAALLVLSVLLPSGCKNVGDFYDSVDLELSRIRETANFIFRYSEGDFVQAERIEAYHNWAVALLGVQLPKKIDYFKYRDRAQQIRMTGSYATGFADITDLEIHTAEQWIPHETAHIYFSLVGTGPTFFNEGVAVAMQTDPYNADFIPREKGGEPVHLVAKRYLLEGRLYPLVDILGSTAFLEEDFTVTYTEAGSFVAFLMDAYGIETLKGLFRSFSGGEGVQEMMALFLAAYGKSIPEAEGEWLAFLTSL
jgi:hypothetical protein